jgi:hypothetical protein
MNAFAEITQYLIDEFLYEPWRICFGQGGQNDEHHSNEECPFKFNEIF